MYYIKYRPQTFSQIQKPNQVADALLRQLKTGKTVHAYLFAGPRGVGKTTMARLLAKGLTCPNLSEDGDVCGQCEFCLGVQNGSLVDLVEIDAASNRGIDDIRDLREKVKLLPARAKKKVYIVDEVHMLTNEAFNALLKTLEEPPKHVVFVLCTTEPHKVPETIKSRCQVFKFARPPKSQIVERLRHIAQAESVLEKVAEEEFERVAIMAGGAFRDAETLLQQIIESGHSASHGDSLPAEYAQFISWLWDGRVKQALTLVNEKYDGGADMAVWTDGLLRYLRDVLYLVMGFTNDFFSLSEEDLLDRKKLALQISRDWLVLAIEQFNQAQNDLKLYSVPQLALELAIAKLARPSDPKNASAGSGCFSSDSNGDSGSVAGNDPEPKSAGAGSKDGKTYGQGQEECAASKCLESATDLSRIEASWSEVVARVSKINNSVGALIKAGRPTGVEGSEILLEVSYKFHKERLESAGNRKLVEKVLAEFFGSNISFKCLVCQKDVEKKDGEVGDLTDLNVRIPQGIVITSTTPVTDVFDGGLPL